MVLVLAGDLPFADASSLRSLVAAIGTGSGAVAVDQDGRVQWLLGAWRRQALVDTIGEAGGTGALAGRSLRSVLERLEPTLVSVPSGEGLPPWFDCDTPEDLAAPGGASTGAVEGPRGQRPGSTGNVPDLTTSGVARGG